MRQATAPPLPPQEAPPEVATLLPAPFLLCSPHLWPHQVPGSPGQPPLSSGQAISTGGRLQPEEGTWATVGPFCVPDPCMSLGSFTGLCPQAPPHCWGGWLACSVCPWSTPCKPVTCSCPHFLFSCPRQSVVRPLLASLLWGGF